MNMITPELFQVLEQKSQECALCRNSWEGFAVILRYLRDAYQRIPTPAEIAAKDAEAIDRLFTSEITHLAVTVSEIFEGEGFEELENYLFDSAIPST